MLPVYAFIIFIFEYWIIASTMLPNESEDSS